MLLIAKSVLDVVLVHAPPRALRAVLAAERAPKEAQDVEVLATRTPVDLHHRLANVVDLDPLGGVRLLLCKKKAIELSHKLLGQRERSAILKAPCRHAPAPSIICTSVVHTCTAIATSAIATSQR